MIRNFFSHMAEVVSQFLQRPIQVTVVCLLLATAGLLFDGSLFRLWRLNRDATELNRRMDKLRVESRELDQKIKRAKDPNFIELEAREKFDLASEGDLIFVFSDKE
jgi:cell division protein FtsB